MIQLIKKYNAVKMTLVLIVGIILGVLGSNLVAFDGWLLVFALLAGIVSSIGLAFILRGMDGVTIEIIQDYINTKKVIDEDGIHVNVDGGDLDEEND